MKKYRILLVFAFLGCFFQLPAQISLNESHQNELMEKMRGERMFVHLSSQILFPGEYLLYKLYITDPTTDGLSSFSKIAYAELIGEQGNQVFFQKIALQDGMGQADFFVPTSVPSGNYKFVGYTSWMRNTEKPFFEKDIVIINPYQADQGKLLSDAATNNKPTQEGPRKDENSKSVEISLDKLNYGNREKVTLGVKSLVEKGFVAHLSISVRKTNDLPSTFRNNKKEQRAGSLQGEGREIFYLPELRGELLTGKIIPRSEDKSQTIKEQRIALSIPGEKILPKISVTDSGGRFFFNLDTERQNEEAVVEVIGEGKNDFTIEVNKISGVNPAVLHFGNFRLTPEMDQEIIRRSVYNQIENAYFEVKPDTLVTSAKDENYMESLITTYNLDAYKRFKTVPETFLEIINSAWIKKNGEGDSFFQVRALENSIGMNQLPLLIVDGVNIQDHEELVFMNSNRIKSIGIIRDKLYIGPEVYQGAILVQTFEGDYYETYAKPYGMKFHITRPEIQQRYFSQKYGESEERDRIPDFRYQLFWEPGLRLETGESKIEFYTSDVDGEFEVVVEGFADNGEPISLLKRFSVE